MQRIPLDSSVLASAGYDPDSAQLDLEFRNGKVYRYRDVPHGVYDFLVRARSKGSYFNRMIEGRYAFTELSSEPPVQDVLEALRASLAARAAKDKA